CARPKHAVRMEAETAMDIIGQVANVYVARLVKIALGNRTKQRLRRSPYRFDERQFFDFIAVVRSMALRPGPVLDVGHRLRGGHTLNPHQPVEPAAAVTAAEAIKMIGIDHA